MNEYLVLGLMSGTSLDGVDLALCRFKYSKSEISYKLLSSGTIPYPYYLKEQLEDALYISTQDLHDLDQKLGSFYASRILDFLKIYGGKPNLIASHGHTILHQPDKGITLQIGDGDVIAQKTGIKVVSDFRLQDVSKGGQGAPLVPIGDKDLFGKYAFCLNLGGIANVSFDLNGTRLACDISPCNMALNTISSWIDIAYDNEGLLASKGKIHQDLLGRLNALKYYEYEAPKSLGKEWFIRKFLPEIRKTELTIEDALRTVNEHIADQVARFINQFAREGSSILVTGGGTYNTFLIELIKNKSKVKLFIPENNLIDFKEAIVFAYLGLLRVRNEINVLASVTGASSDTSAGIINNPNK
ncbi:MAG: anhydro-N-acetylmuramic acid kinase [Bacteroidales bacterium]|jgi:anhydro-N-acetylmuramic acid kinase|nr:anhydro-N-acetylmuramic acid kinase [Bacteroidales bacterium]